MVRILGAERRFPQNPGGEKREEGARGRREVEGVSRGRPRDRSMLGGPGFLACPPFARASILTPPPSIRLTPVHSFTPLLPHTLAGLSCYAVARGVGVHSRFCGLKTYFVKGREQGGAVC